MLVSSLGISAVFFISAVTSALGAVFTFFFIPRTKDKSMYELEMLFTKTDKIQKKLEHFCEAQGKGRARCGPRKVTERSFMDGGWWMVDILSLMLYTKFGCHHPPKV